MGIVSQYGVSFYTIDTGLSMGFFIFRDYFSAFLYILSNRESAFPLRETRFLLDFICV